MNWGVHEEMRPSIEAMVRFARRNGKDWKEVLFNAWWSGRYWEYGAPPKEDQGPLQRMRNDPGYGPGSEFWRTCKVRPEAVYWYDDDGIHELELAP